MTALPDPRPDVSTSTSGAPVLNGWRCASCHRPSALTGPWCPHCRGPLKREEFELRGVVWSATVLRVPLPGREPPIALAYVDLDGGPRILGHIRTHSEHRLTAGTKVHGVGLSSDGDLTFEAQE